MERTFKNFSLLLISTIIFFGRQESNVIAGEIGSELAISDTLKYINIPVRPNDAIDGSQFADQITGLSIEDREKAAVREILAGNVPSFSRKLKPLTINHTIGTSNYELIFYTVCDYMAIGSDLDYLYIPMTPSTAQYLANQLDCSLPTKKIVDIIYTAAEIKLQPQPIPPSDEMTTVPVFRQHTDSIKQQISRIGLDRSADNVIAGHKKDIIISNKIYSSDRNYDRVVIYGWHLSINNPIQPVYNGHIAMYADYSHGVRLISNTASINGDSVRVSDILKDPNLSVLLSSEGSISTPYYPPSDFFTALGSRSKNPLIEFKLNQNYPNPFNPTTIINYQLAKISAVDLSVFNLLGQKVLTLVSKEQPAGDYKVEWDAQAVASGVYFYKLKAGIFEESRKMLLLR